MADDPYDILGVARGATEEEIRRRYLKLVKELHPDVNPTRAAEDRFKKVTVAHDVIGDPERRRQYDRGEIDGAGERRYGARQHESAGARGGRGRGPMFEDFGDVFADFFANGRAGARGGPGMGTRGRDVRYTLEVEFLEAIQGTKKRVTLPEGGLLDLGVPAGVTDGQVLRLRARGQPGTGGAEAGDALVEVRIRPHREFRREGDDILSEVPVTIDEAVLGAKIEVATATGRVQLTIPKGTSSGQVFRLKGKGVRNAASGVTGDQLVAVRIVLPDTIDESLSYFMSEWRKQTRYDPRG